jgi:hypothetical protein
MRFGPRPVKLRIANLDRFHDRAAISARRPIPVETPEMSEIFVRIRALGPVAIAARRDIDENGSLPYKPRNLSAMTRSYRWRLIWAGSGPIWASQHHRTRSQWTYLNSAANWPVSGERTREADLSTQQTGAEAPSRLPRSPCHDRRPQGSRGAPRPRPQASERLKPDLREF